MAPPITAPATAPGMKPPPPPICAEGPPPPPPLKRGPGAPPPALNRGPGAPPPIWTPAPPWRKPPPTMCCAAPPPARTPAPGLPPLGIWAKLAVGATIGKTSAIAAAVLKTLRLIIVGSIHGTQSNPYDRQTFPSLALIVRGMKLSGRNCTRNEWIAPIPRQPVSAIIGRHSRRLACGDQSPERADLTGQFGLPMASEPHPLFGA